MTQALMFPDQWVLSANAWLQQSILLGSAFVVVVLAQRDHLF